VRFLEARLAVGQKCSDYEPLVQCTLLVNSQTIGNSHLKVAGDFGAFAARALHGFKTASM
jgi:hypothetical protein